MIELEYSCCYQITCFIVFTNEEYVSKREIVCVDCQKPESKILSVFGIYSVLSGVRKSYQFYFCDLIIKSCLALLALGFRPSELIWRLELCYPHTRIATF